MSPLLFGPAQVSHLLGCVRQLFVPILNVNRYKIRTDYTKIVENISGYNIIHKTYILLWDRMGNLLHLYIYTYIYIYISFHNYCNTCH